MESLDQLREAVGAEHVLTDPEVTRSYGTDWTGRWSITPRAVVRPASTAEVAAVVRVCAEERVPVVPQGGNTGLVGGSVPGSSESVVLSLRRLTEHSPVDRLRRQVTVGAGMTVAQVHAVAAESGLAYGVDLASRDSATIGGTVATNAGGVRVVRFGDTRAQVLGVEAVFADGTVMDRTAALPKDSAGYDISRLLVGSEGTLAVLTAVRLLLRDPLPRDRVTAMVGVGSLSDAVGLLTHVSSSRTEVLAAEYIDDYGMQLVCAVADLPHPLSGRWPYYLLTETTRTPQFPDGRCRRPQTLGLPRKAARGGRISGSRTRLRHRVASRLSRRIPHAAPITRATARAFTFGHLAEGNVHIHVNGPSAEDHRSADAVLAAVAALGGSVSSEHGIGRAKPKYLTLSRDAAEIAAMRGIKRALDPRGYSTPACCSRSRHRPMRRWPAMRVRTSRSRPTAGDGSPWRVRAHARAHPGRLRAGDR